MLNKYTPDTAQFAVSGVSYVYLGCGYSQMPKVETIVCFSSTWLGLRTMIPYSPTGFSLSVIRYELSPYFFAVNGKYSSLLDNYTVVYFSPGLSTVSS